MGRERIGGDPRHRHGVEREGDPAGTDRVSGDRRGRRRRDLAALDARHVLGDRPRDRLRTRARRPVPGVDLAHRQVADPAPRRAGRQRRRHEPIAHQDHDLDRGPSVSGGAWPPQPPRHVATIERDPGGTVCGQGRRGLTARRAVGAAAQRRPSRRQRRPHPLGQARHAQRADVQRPRRLRGDRGQPRRRSRPRRVAHPVADVIEARPRDRRERQHPTVGARRGHQLPGLDRAPVVADDVHRPSRRAGVDDRRRVVGELGEIVGRERRRSARRPGAADVVRDHVVLQRQPRHHLRPHRRGVGVAMDQQQRRRVTRPGLEHRQVDVAGADGPPLAGGHHAAAAAAARTWGTSSSSQAARPSSWITSSSSNLTPTPP